MIDIGATIGAMLATISGGGAIQNGPMTLDQAIHYAEANAFAIRLQESVIEKNHQKVNEARGNLGPQISIGGTYTRYNQAITTSFGPGQPPITIQPIDTKAANATLQLPIDISGNKTRLLRAGVATKNASELTLRASYNDTRLNVRQTYFAVLRAKALIDVDQKALDDAKGRLDQGQKQFDQQQVARLDVTRYKAQVAQSTSDLISAKDSLTLANYALNLALARPIETPVDVVDVTSLPAVDAPEDNLVKAAQARRPEVLSALETIRGLALVTRATEAGMNPTLNLQIQYLQTIDPQGFTAIPAQAVGTLLLTVPIFDSGITRSKVKEARQDEVQAKVSLEQTRLGISQEVRNAVANMVSAKARLDNATEQVKLATEVFRLAQVRQDAGAGTYYEVIDAESQLTLARNGEVSARYDYLTSYSQLQRAVGADDITAALANSDRAPNGRKR